MRQILVQHCKKALGLLTAALVLVTTQNLHADIIQVPADDPAVISAMQDARGTLDRVLAKTVSPKGTASKALLFKVRVPATSDPSHFEYIWVGSLKRRDTTWRGRYENQPVHFRGRLGGPARFNHDQIMDWTFEHQGKLYGGYSVRALLPYMQQSEARAMRDVLSRNPVPSGW